MVKKSKVFCPRKIKGGATVGKEGETWFVVKTSNLSNIELKAFKKYMHEACKEFFQPESDEDEK